MASAPVFILRGALMQHDFLLALMQHDFVLALMQHDFVLALMQNDFVLACIRLTRTAAERGPVLFGECGQVTGFQSLASKRLAVCEPPQ
jgi:hypothetical protein